MAGDHAVTKAVTVDLDETWLINLLLSRLKVKVQVIMLSTIYWYLQYFSRAFD